MLLYLVACYSEQWSMRWSYLNSGLNISPTLSQLKFFELIAESVINWSQLQNFYSKNPSHILDHFLLLNELINRHMTSTTNIFIVFNHLGYSANRLVQSAFIRSFQVLQESSVRQENRLCCPPVFECCCMSDLWLYQKPNKKVLV